MSAAGISKEKIHGQLAELGVLPSDTLLVHSSLRKLGPVQGGAEGFLDALEEYLSAGLLVLPTLTFESVNRERPVFSVLDTPSCVGALPEIFRRRKGAVRSWHPTHSVAASGDGAKDFAAGHERFETPCARESPWGKLLDRRGKILFIGAPLNRNTFLHGVEEWADVPCRLSHDKVMLKVKTPKGEMIDVPSRCHAPGISEHYGKLAGILLKEGIMRKGPLGRAECALMDIDPLTRLTMRLLERDIFLFSHDRVPASVD